MKISGGRCKIVAVQLGEATLNFLRPDEAPIKAKVALLNEGGESCGYFMQQRDWSDKTIEALRIFAEAVEEDTMAHLFEGEATIEAEPEESPNYPPQF